jgi:hypothetical protein
MEQPVDFPEQSGGITDRPVLTMVVLAPDVSRQDRNKTLKMVETMTRECRNSSRTFKSVWVWCAAESAGTIYDEARRVLAWENIQDEQDELHLDEGKKRQLNANVERAKRDLKESVWRKHFDETGLSKRT